MDTTCSSIAGLCCQRCPRINGVSCKMCLHGHMGGRCQSRMNSLAASSEGRVCVQAKVDPRAWEYNCILFEDFSVSAQNRLRSARVLHLNTDASHVPAIVAWVRKELRDLSALILHSDRDLFVLDDIDKLTGLSQLRLHGDKDLLVPNSIGKLTGLSQLSLYGGRYLKDLPADIGELTGLLQLSLHSGRDINVSDDIGKLTRLSQLSLHGGRYVHVPDDIGKLTGLSALSLYGVESLRVPDDIGKLTGLSQLSLYGGMYLKDLPADIGELTGLSKLSLHSGNDLRVPDGIRNLTGLSELSLHSGNDLHVPDGIGNLTKLTHLDLQSEDLMQVPECIGNLTSLCHLKLLCPNLRKLPEGIGKCQNLSYLKLDGCRLLTLPKALLNLTANAACMVYCSASLLCAGQPDVMIVGRGGWPRQHALEDLKIRILRAVIDEDPDCISQATGWSEISLNGCKLTYLPENIAKCRQLTFLDLSECRALALPTALLKLTTEQACEVDCTNSKFAQDFDMKPGRRSLDDVKAQIVRAVALQSLLNDRDARQASLDSVVVVAVLLTTAAFVAFAQPPSVADAFKDDGPEEERQRRYLRKFFKANQATFVLSMSVVLLYLVSSIPTYRSEDELAEAVWVWLVYCAETALLAAAGVAGILTFFYAAYATYPPDLVDEDVRPVWIAAILVIGVPVVITGFKRLYRLRPGCRAVRRVVKEWFWSGGGTKRKVRPPTDGVDESAAKILQQMKIQHAEHMQQATEQVKILKDLVSALYTRHGNPLFEADGEAPGPTHMPQWRL